MIDPIANLAEVSATKRSFYHAVMSKFLSDTVPMADKEAIFKMLGLTKPATDEAFRAATDAYYDSKRAERKRRHRQHRMAVAESEVRRVMREALKIAGRERQLEGENPPPFELTP